MRSMTRGKVSPAAMVGHKFGLLTVVAIGKSNGQKRYWKCICDCGERREVRGDALRSGSTRCCGCLGAQRIHGAAGTPEYSCWKAMRRRCLVVDDPKYSAYGGRGVRVCARWLSDFSSFRDDMGARPSAAHSIDRINNDGHYSCGKCEECIRNGWPANCRWATHLDQINNRRNTVAVRTGEERVLAIELARRNQISDWVFYKRLRVGWDPTRAATTPVRRRPERPMVRHPLGVTTKATGS